MQGSAPILDGLKREVDLLLRGTRTNESDEMSNGIAVSVAHHGDQVFQELPVIVQVDLLLDNLLASLR